MRRWVALAVLVHPAPALTVTVLAAALGTILAVQAGAPVGWRLALTVLAVAGSQILTGALNDWADRHRDALAQSRKPIPAGRASPRDALVVAVSGAVIQLGVSLPLGAPVLVLGGVASLSAVAYNLWLSRTPLSLLPYLVSFGVLPLWVAAGVGVDLGRVALSPLLVGPFAAAAHLANAVRDFDGDQRIGSRNLAQVLGRRTAFRLAWGLAAAVGVAGASLVGGNASPAVVGLGLVGLIAILQGAVGPVRLWPGIMVAAVCWTAAWAFATG